MKERTGYKKLTKSSLLEYIDQDREIEFQYKDKKYSITYGEYRGKDVISFCEFYQETTEVTTVNELLYIIRDGVSVLEMWESISKDDVWLF